MDQKKILLISLDKGKLKGSSDLLGSLLMAKIQMAALFPFPVCLQPRGHLFISILTNSRILPTIPSPLFYLKHASTASPLLWLIKLYPKYLQSLEV